MKKKNKNLKLAIIGLGYVGLPLAIEFAKKRLVIGFDINKKRVKQLKSGIDKNLEIINKKIRNSKKLYLTNNKEKLKSANCYIVTVPTPLNILKKPDLTLLIKATKMLSKIIKKGDLIIYESTVYPGCTEEICVPILEKNSKLRYNQGFFCGYSPERINVGDKDHQISKIKKITSGSTPEISILIDDLYNEIIEVGTHMVESIKIAEAAKIIENTQRDLNIALMNEFSIIFNMLNIDTNAVINAAASKWNFIPYKPGLVGGHCIGVDPYYLAHKANSIGYKPKVLLAGRAINESMPNHAALKFIREMKKKNIQIKKSRILIMGLTFKENCTDLRNSGAKKLITELKKFKCDLDLYDPWADTKEVKKLYNINLTSKLIRNIYDGVVIVISHNDFKKLGILNIKNLCKKNHVIFDLKNTFDSSHVDIKL